MAYLNQSDVELIQISATCRVLFPELTPVSLLESGSGGFEIVTQLTNTEKRPSSHL
jgi:hypothetical protein